MAVVISIVVIALVFDYINGFHDAANSIATVVSTRVLSPRMAVAWAAFFNFVAFIFFPLHVANTIGKGIIDPHIVDNTVVAAALIGAIGWNLITWWYGIPSSSSHALMGGLIGAGISKGGTSVLGWAKITQTAVFIILSPIIGLLVGGALLVAVAWILRRFTPGKVDRWFRRLQLVSAALFSLGHGGNDAQKTMGIIAVLLYANGLTGATFEVPFWVVLVCALAMGLGTLIGRLAHRAHDGDELDQAQTGAGLLRRDGRRVDAVPGHGAGRAGVDDAHHHGRDRRRRLGDAAERRALGRGAAHRVGLVADDPVGGVDRGGQLLCAARFQPLKTL